ncbi:MAG: hypothetical protein K9L17_11520 [Clostridiales bacterium]|nr:hypothetical protein [Clostridiales bacterium]MCF8023311.1 hypothetical protein [Clostridiales bacterium]
MVKRLDDLNRFYTILNRLEAKTGKRSLAECHWKMDWPFHGIYFFFEDGEFRGSNGEPRVVRVGTHAVSNDLSYTLWECLRTHRGSKSGKFAGGGSHRNSDFRLHVGTALINWHGINLNTWGEGKTSNYYVRKTEHWMELKVSEKIRSMPFIWVKAEDKLGPGSVRNFIYKNAVALLSNYNRQVIDGPSNDWLGLYCSSEFVRRSGLWNDENVIEQYNPAFLDALDNLVEGM